MTRSLLLLLAAAAFVTCLVGVPVLIAGSDDDTPAKSSHTTLAGTDANDARGAQSGWAWLKALALAADTTSPAPGDLDDDDAHLGPHLTALDKALDDGIARCAPEILGYDRALLVKLQPDWHILKPNVRPSWRAWRSLPGVVLDEKKVDDCTAAFAQARDCSALAGKWTECTAPFRGTLGEGEQCTTNEQCASTSCAYGVCTRPNDCEKNTECPEGMLCAESPDPSFAGFLTCVATPKQGEACVAGGVVDEAHPDDVNNCGPGLACDVEGLCFPARREGARCGAGQPCAAPLYCGEDDDGDMICMKSEPEAIPEELVDNNPDASDESCSCDPLRDGKACVDGRCVDAQIVDKGEACDASHLCRGSMGVTACIDGYCRDALGAGDACGDHDQCKDDLVCRGGACAEPARPGEACTTSDDCIFGLECNEPDPSAPAGATNTCGLAQVAEPVAPPDHGLHGRPVLHLEEVLEGNVEDGNVDPPSAPTNPDEGAPQDPGDAAQILDDVRGLRRMNDPIID